MSIRSEDGKEMGMADEKEWLKESKQTKELQKGKGLWKKGTVKDAEPAR